MHGLTLHRSVVVAANAHTLRDAAAPPLPLTTEPFATGHAARFFYLHPRVNASTSANTGGGRGSCSWVSDIHVLSIDVPGTYRYGRGILYTHRSDSKPAPRLTCSVAFRRCRTVHESLLCVVAPYVLRAAIRVHRLYEYQSSLALTSMSGKVSGAIAVVVFLSLPSRDPVRATPSDVSRHTTVRARTDECCIPRDC